MKNIVALLLLMSVLSSIVFSQAADSSVASHQTNHQLKSKRQKTAGTLLLIAGGVMAGISFGMVTKDLSGLFDPNSPGYTSSSNDTITDVLGYGGLSLMAGSIPLFIASKKNKRKAVSLLFRNETAPQGVRSNLSYEFVPSLSLRVHL